MGQSLLGDFDFEGGLVFTLPKLLQLLDQSLRVSQIAKKLNTSKQRVHYHVKELLLKGFILENPTFRFTYRVNWDKVKTQYTKPLSRSKLPKGVEWQPQRFVAVFNVLRPPVGDLLGFVPYDNGRWRGYVLKRDGVSLHLKPKKLEIHINNVRMGSIESQAAECEARALEWGEWFSKEYQSELSLEGFRPCREWFLTDRKLSLEIQKRLALRKGEQVAGLWVDKTPFVDGTVEVGTDERRRLDDLFSGRLQAQLEAQTNYIIQLQKAIEELQKQNAALIQLVQSKK